MDKEHLKSDSEPTENINQMLVRHRKEIIDLHSRCKHERFTNWRSAPDNQGGGMFRACIFCGKVERSRLISPILKVNLPEQERKEK